MSCDGFGGGSAGCHVMDSGGGGGGWVRRMSCDGFGAGQEGVM